MTSPNTSLSVGSRLPPTLVFLPRSPLRRKYLGRYAPIAGEWPSGWEFDGVALGGNAIAWEDTGVVTHVTVPDAVDPCTAPMRTALLIAHNGRFVPEGVARMADVQQCTPAELLALLRKGLTSNRQGMLSVTLPRANHGTFRGFNYIGNPWVPNPRKRA